MLRLSRIVWVGFRLRLVSILLIWLYMVWIRCMWLVNGVSCCFVSVSVLWLWLMFIRMVFG